MWQFHDRICPTYTHAYNHTRSYTYLYLFMFLYQRSGRTLIAKRDSGIQPMM